MRCRALLALLSLTALSAYAPIPFPKPNRDPMKQIQGSWRASVYARGNGANVGGAGTLCVDVTGNLWAFSREMVPGGPRTAGAKYTFTLDPKRKPPTMLFVSATAKGSLRLLGVYQFQKEELHVVFVVDSAGKLEEFPPAVDKPRAGDYILKMSRIKKP